MTDRTAIRRKLLRLVDDRKIVHLRYPRPVRDGVREEYQYDDGFLAIGETEAMAGLAAEGLVTHDRSLLSPLTGRPLAVLTPEGRAELVMSEPPSNPARDR